MHFFAHTGAASGGHHELNNPVSSLLYVQNEEGEDDTELQAKITAQLENTNFIVFIGVIACTHAHTCTLLLGAILFTVLLLPRPGLLSLTFMRLLFTFCTPHL